MDSFQGNTKKKKHVIQRKDDVSSDSQDVSSDKESTGFGKTVKAILKEANSSDLIILGVGLILSILTGLGNPLLAMRIGQITDLLIKYTASVERNGTEQSFTWHTNGNTLKIKTRSVNDFNTITTQEFLDESSRQSMYFVYLWIAVLVASFIQTLCWEVACDQIVHKLKVSYLSQLLRQDLAWFETHNEGELAGKLTNVLERMKAAAGIKIAAIFSFLTFFISGMIVALLSNWKLSLVVIACYPLVFGIGAFNGKCLMNLAKSKSFTSGSKVASEVLSGMKRVIAFSAEDFEIKRYSNELAAGSKLFKKIALGQALALTLTVSLNYFCQSLAVWYSTVLYANEELTAGAMYVIFFTLLSRAMMFGDLFPDIMDIVSSVCSVGKVMQVIKRIPKTDPYSDLGLKPKYVQGHITLSDVKFSYPLRPDVKVLNGLSLDIPAKNVIAFVGPSGSGKSTIINLLMKFYDITEGKIQIDGISIQDLNTQWLRNQIGLVSQEPALFQGTIKENIMYGNVESSMRDVVAAAKTAHAHDFIINFPDGYETQIKEGGTSLSGGQKQRIAIARALVRHPKILILDEATSALDKNCEELVQQALEAAMVGRTTVIIAHRLSTIKNADIICVLKEGKIVEIGSHNELMEAKRLYYKLVSIQEHLTFDEIRRLSRVKTSMKVSTVSAINFESINSKAPEENVQKNAPGYIKVLFALPFLRPWVMVVLLGCIVVGFHTAIASFLFSSFTTAFLGDKIQFEEDAVFVSKGFLVLGICTLIAIFIPMSAAPYAEGQLSLYIRQKLYENLLKQPLSWFQSDNNSPSSLINMIESLPNQAQEMCGRKLGTLIVSTVYLITLIAVVLYSNWQLGLIILALYPILIISLIVYSIKVYNAFKVGASQLNQSSLIALEAIKNFKTVQMCGIQHEIIKRYTTEINLSQSLYRKEAVTFSITSSLLQSTMFLINGAAFKYGSLFISKGYMDITDIYRCIFILMINTPVIGLSAVCIKDLMSSKQAFDQLYQVMTTQSKVDPFSERGQRPVIKGNIKFKGITFEYPGKTDVPLLRGIDLKITAGQTVALVGESGCGKSTLISLLERFYEPSFGTMFVEGIDITNINVKHLRNNIGLVTQEPILFNTTIRENIAYGLISQGENVSEQQIIEAAKQANIHDFIKSLPQGYDTVVGEHGSMLSGGQKQRIAIASALIRNPPILLLDEATSALDTESEKIVQDSLDRARQSRTTIVIAHRLSTIQNADLICVIARGKIRETGTHEQLMKLKGRYYNLVVR